MTVTNATITEAAPELAPIFTAETEHMSDDGWSQQHWTEYTITSGKGEPHGSAAFTAPPGVSERTFEGRVNAAAAVLNGHAHEDLALLYKLATIDAEASADHWSGIYWEILGTSEAKADEQRQGLALAIDPDPEAFALAEFDQLLEQVRALKRQNAWLRARNGRPLPRALRGQGRWRWLR